MSVFAVASSVAAFVKVRFLGDKEVIDTFDFRLHYRFTSAALFLCCALCTANSLIGNPISCIVDNDKQAKAITTYCWVTSTFTVPRLKGGVPGMHVAAPGVGPHLKYEDVVHHHRYYQWVPFVLFFQGLLFYTPHWLWKKWEGSLIRKITNGIRGPQLESPEKITDKMEPIMKYLLASRNTHTSYAASYLFCVALNLANTIANMYLINYFLGGTFLKYGLEVLKFPDSQIRMDPMADVFPKITKCTFHKYGPSGSIVEHDIMCVLALNVLNEKIYIFLWFWLIILAVISGLGFLYTLALYLSPTVRTKILRRAFSVISPAMSSYVSRKLQAGDFLLLHLLGQNMQSSFFNELLKQLLQHMNFRMPFEKNNSNIELAPLYPKLDTMPKVTA